MEEKTFTIKDMPKEERPRERLLKYGAKHISNQELLAILLGSGTRKETVTELANRVLMHFEGIGLLRDATIEELTAIKGIGKAKGVQLLAAIELGRRMSIFQQEDKYFIRSPRSEERRVGNECRAELRRERE